MNFKKSCKLELKDFINDAATLAAGAKIYSDGIQYVDNSMFWDWITNSYKNSQFLSSAESMQQFVNAHPNQMQGITSLLQGKGFEWDVFREYHPSLININKLPLDANARIADVSTFNPFDGLTQDIQVKTSLSNPSSLVKSMLNKYPESTKFAVNQSVYDEAIKQGIPNDRFIKVIPDEKLKNITNDRIEDAMRGNAEIGISLNGVLKEVGKGAVIGTVLYIGVSALTNYHRYRNGEMSSEEFKTRLLKDGAKGGLMGGSMAGINVGVQWSMIQLGLAASNPIAIPVLIVVSYGLKKILDPIFKDGSYSDSMENIQYYNQLGNGWLNFGKMSHELYLLQGDYLHTLQQSQKKSEVLNYIESKVDDNLEKLIDEI